MKKNKNLILLVVLLLAVDFAAVTTTLFINGTIGYQINKSDFEVYYSKALINGVEDNSVITDDTHIVFTEEMKNVGDTYILDYDVTNGYTTNLNTGTSYYSDQTVTISNNFNAVDSTCTITMALRNYAATNSSYAATVNSEAATKNTVAATATTTNANAKTTYTSMQVNGCDCSYPGCRHSGGYQGVGGIPDGHCAICGVGWNNQGMTVQVPHTTYSCPSG